MTDLFDLCKSKKAGFSFEGVQETLEFSVIVLVRLVLQRECQLFEVYENLRLTSEKI